MLINFSAIFNRRQTMLCPQLLIHVALMVMPLHSSVLVCVVFFPAKSTIVAHQEVLHWHLGVEFWLIFKTKWPIFAHTNWLILLIKPMLALTLRCAAQDFIMASMQASGARCLHWSRFLKSASGAYCIGFEGSLATWGCHLCGMHCPLFQFHDLTDGVLAWHASRKFPQAQVLQQCSSQLTRTFALPS